MDIVEELRQNRESGAKRLVCEYKAGLMVVARRFFLNESDAEEAVNTTFAKVIENIDGFLEKSSLFTWMCQILVNEFRASVRRKSNDMEVMPGVLPDVPDEDAQEAIFRNLDHSLLREAVNGLPDDQREAVVLHYFMDMPVAKIAKILAVPNGTVFSRLHYARKALAAKLGVKAHEAVKKPGGKATLIALALCATAALGAVWWGELSERAATILGSGGVAPRATAFGETGETGETSGYSPVASTPTPVPPDSPVPPVITPSPFSKEPNMNTTLRTLAASAAIAAAGAATSVNAADYTWMASPADAKWNTTSLNWNSGEAWVDGNNAVFPASSSTKSITLSSMRTANDVTVNGGGTGNYSFGGALVKVNGKLTVNFTASNQALTLASGFGGDSVRIGGNSSGTFYLGWDKTPTIKTTYLEDSVVLAPNDRHCFGPDPSAPSTNIVISGTPSLYANGNVNLSNRVIRIESGKTLKLGAASDKTFTLGPIAADPSEGQAFSTNAFVHLPNYWRGLVKFAPGAGVTNDVGRLEVDSRLEVASGVTRIASPDGFKVGCGVNSPLYVVGDNSGYSDTKGNVIVSGGELYLPQGSRYAEMSKYAQMTIRDGGKVYAPSTHWLMGMQGTGGAMLSVSNNGEFAVGTLRLGQGSSWPNSVHLSKGGTLRAGSLTLEFKNNQNVAFNFDGGRFQSVASQDAYSTLISNPTNEKWAGVHFYVREGGAILDSTNGKHLWWGRPLESGAASDGGLTCVIKSGKSVVLCDAAVCTYNGPTRVEGSGQMQVRVANGLPATTTLQIGPNTQVGFNSSWSAGHDLDQTVARVEGIGTAGFNTKLVVTGGVSPVFDGAYGPLTFNNVCSLSGTYDIVGDANGCGHLKVAADQDISWLALNTGNMAAMDRNAAKDKYKILDAPNGYTGQFSLAEGFPKDKWDVRYTATAAYLVPIKAFVISVR